MVGDSSRLDNAMLLLDSFFQYLSTAMAKEKCFEVHITPHSNIDLDSVWDDLLYDGYTLNDSTEKPPLGVFEASPVFGKRVPTFSIELLSETALSIIITQVYNYRELPP